MEFWNYRHSVSLSKNYALPQGVAHALPQMLSIEHFEMQNE